MEFRRDGDIVYIGDKLAVERGARRVTAVATTELLSNEQTADHYFAGTRVIGADADGEDVTREGVDALGEKIEVGKEMTYLDWVGFQREGDGKTEAFYVYRMEAPTTAEAKARNSDEPFWHEKGVHDTEEQAISAALELA